MVLRIVVAIVAAVTAGVWLIRTLAPISAVPAGTSSSGFSQPVAGDQTLEITEDELTRLLNQQLAGQEIGTTPMGPASLQHVTVKLSGGRIQADGDALIGSATVPISVTATGNVDSGRVLVTIEDIRAVGVSLPVSARSSLQQSIQSRVDAEVDRSHLQVKAVSIDGGKLVLTGSASPVERRTSRRRRCPGNVRSSDRVRPG